MNVDYNIFQKKFKLNEQTKELVDTDLLFTD